MQTLGQPSPSFSLVFSSPVASPFLLTSFYGQPSRFSFGLLSSPSASASQIHLFDAGLTPTAPMASPFPSPSAMISMDPHIFVASGTTGIVAVLDPRLASSQTKGPLSADANPAEAFAKPQAELFLKHNGQPIFSLASSQWILAAGSSDGRISFWDIRKSSGLLCFFSESHADDVTALCFFPSTARFVSGSADGMLCLFDLDHPAVPSEPESAHMMLRLDQPLNSLGFLREGTACWYESTSNELGVVDIPKALVEWKKQFQPDWEDDSSRFMGVGAWGPRMNWYYGEKGQIWEKDWGSAEAKRVLYTLDPEEWVGGVKQLSENVKLRKTGLRLGGSMWGSLTINR